MRHTEIRSEMNTRGQTAKLHAACDVAAIVMALLIVEYTEKWGHVDPRCRQNRRWPCRFAL